MSTTDRSKPTRNERLRQVAAGLRKHYPNVALTLASRTFGPSELENAIQKDIELTDTTEKAHAAWRTQVKAERDSHAALAPALRALRAQVTAQHGDDAGAAAVLADFGYKPRKSTARTTAEKAGSVEKARATRKARHTMGSVQKQEVTGNVVGIVVTPVTTTPSTPQGPGAGATSSAQPSPGPTSAPAHTAS